MRIVVNRTCRGVEQRIVALLARMHGIGIHTLLEGVCMHGCQCAHSGVSPAHRVNFPLRLLLSDILCILSGDFLRARGYYDLNAIFGRGRGISLINHLVARHLFWWCKKFPSMHTHV